MMTELKIGTASPLKIAAGRLFKAMMRGRARIFACPVSCNAEIAAEIDSPAFGKFWLELSKVAFANYVPPGA